jgi:hypothetical protein
MFNYCCKIRLKLIISYRCNLNPSNETYCTGNNRYLATRRAIIVLLYNWNSRYSNSTFTCMEKNTCMQERSKGPHWALGPGGWPRYWLHWKQGWVLRQTATEVSHWIDRGASPTAACLWQTEKCVTINSWKYQMSIFGETEMFKFISLIRIICIKTTF